MTSRRGALGTALILLAIPLALLLSRFLGDAGTWLHVLLGAGFVIVSCSVFDFGTTLFFGDWNAVEAEKHILRAFELNPSYSTAHLVYSVLLATAGRLDEAIEQDRRAIELDPFSLIIHSNASGTLFLARRYDESLAQANQALVRRISPLLLPSKRG